MIASTVLKICFTPKSMHITYMPTFQMVMTPVNELWKSFKSLSNDIHNISDS